MNKHNWKVWAYNIIEVMALIFAGLAFAWAIVFLVKRLVGMATL